MTNRRRKNRRAHLAGDLRSLMGKKGTDDPVYYFQEGLVSMSLDVAQRVYIIQHKARSLDGRRLYYSVAALSCIPQVSLATLFISEEEAERARSKLPVATSAQLETVNLFEHLIEARNGEQESFEDAGLEDPTNDDDEPGKWLAGGGA